MSTTSVFSIIDAVDEHLSKPRSNLREDQGRQPHRYWPSEASVEFIENNERKVLGRCIRAVAYSHLDIEATDPTDPRGLRILSVGKVVEELEIQWAKDAGFYYDNNVKFQHEHQDIIVSGEVDMFIKTPDGTIEGIEFKSGYGYNFEKEVFGSLRSAGYPKADNLMQTMLYLDHFKNKGITTFTLVYVNRGDMTRTEHRVNLVTDDSQPGQTHWKYEAPMEPTLARVQSKMKKSKTRHTTTERRFSVTDIYNRYLALDDSLKKDMVPARDYEKSYSREKIERKYKAKEIGKTKYEKYQKTGAPIGDWQCLYCKYKEMCYKSPQGAHHIKDIPEKYKSQKVVDLLLPKETECQNTSST